MPIVNDTQPGFNATFWGENPLFKNLILLLSQRDISVEPIQTDRTKSWISIGTPSIVIFWGEKTNSKDINEIDIRDLKISYEPVRTKTQTNPHIPDSFTKVSQISRFASSYLRAHGYIVNVSTLNPNQLPDLELDLAIRFDLIDPSEIPPEILMKELGLNY